MVMYTLYVHTMYTFDLRIKYILFIKSSEYSDEYPSIKKESWPTEQKKFSNICKLMTIVCIYMYILGWHLMHNPSGPRIRSPSSSARTSAMGCNHVGTNLGRKPTAPTVLSTLTRTHHHPQFYNIHRKTPIAMRYACRTIPSPFE